MQLVAYGAQDIYLTGNPQITFFKSVYRRHTNFSMENIQQTFSGPVDFGKRSTVTVSRNGDLINSAYVQVVLPSLSNDMWASTGASPIVPDDYELVWTNFTGLALLQSVEVEIGGQPIDKHYSTWMYAWQELTMTSEKADGYKRMVGGVDAMGWLSLGNSSAHNLLRIPLDFWFNINAGLSLPLIALQYHEVKFVFNFEEFRNLVIVVDKNSGDVLERADWRLVGPAPTPQIDMFIDYIYLDTDERRKFAQMSHEYLIEQVQQTEQSIPIKGAGGLSNQRLSFNHPCKELIWFFVRNDNLENNDWFNFSGAPKGHEKLGPDMLKTAQLKLNGHPRFSPARDPLFFRQWQPFIHHTTIPDSNLYVYSFALRPEEHQPSGTCNFSRIDNTHLELQMNTKDADYVSPIPGVEPFPVPDSVLLTVYARNYNVLRIMSGMGGLAYSN
jgi:hypothetical protein